MKRFKLISIAIFVIFIHFQGFAQISDSITKIKPIKYPKEKFISTGLSYNNVFSFQLDFYSANEAFGHGQLYFLNGYKYGIETTYIKNLIIAPKISYEINAMFLCLRAGIVPYFSNKNFDLRILPEISYEINAMFLCLRAGIVPYFSNKNFDLRILPEIGFSLYGRANLCYGYNIPINKSIPEISNHKISLIINIKMK